MRILLTIALWALIAEAAHAGPISPRDRVYTADQTSNTITVMDPSSNRTLGTIALSPSRLDGLLGPQYVQQADVHGLGFSKDGKYLCVVDVTTDSVEIIETASNRVISSTVVGRSPHEAFFAPDGKTVWVAIRGESDVAVIDPFAGRVIERIGTADGPSKVVFAPDGSVAYVNHIRSATIDVIDVASRKVIGQISGLANSFSSDEMVSPDGAELWVAHKMSGETSVIDTKRKVVSTVLRTGPGTNHPNFADTPHGSFAYVTVGGLNQTLVYRRDNGTPVLVSRIKNTGFEPHGLWPSPDFSRMYVVLEKSDHVDVIDTASMRVIATMPTGQESQALVYVADAVPNGSGTDGLGRQGLGLRVKTQAARVVGLGSAEVTVREVSGLDEVVLSAAKLQPDHLYVLHSYRDGKPIPIMTFETDGRGALPQALAFLKVFGVYDLRFVVTP